MTSRFFVAVAMTARETARNRTACVLALVLPLLFYGLALLTTSERIVVFQLASLSLEPDIEASGRSEALVFMALIAIGFMSAFFGVNLMQKHGHTNRRLVICGYRPFELVLSKLLVLAASVAIVSLWCLALMTTTLFVPRHPAAVFAGLVLVGYVYGCYGLMMTGAFTDRGLGLSALGALAYGTVLLVIAICVFWRQVRMAVRRVLPSMAVAR